MIFAVFFEDEEKHADQRRKHMAAHLAFLESQSAAIRAAGPLKDVSDQAPAGGLWLIEADNLEAVQTLVETDPFWPTGLRKAVRILEWTQVFAEGKRRI